MGVMNFSFVTGGVWKRLRTILEANERGVDDGSLAIRQHISLDCLFLMYTVLHRFYTKGP